MKKIISAFLVIGMGLAGDLKIGIKQIDQRDNPNAYGLSCDGARGTVKYYVEGLPNGVSFADATINISNNARAGTYNVRIRAIDQFGQSAERIISLTISQAISQNGNINAGQSGQFQGQQRAPGQLTPDNSGQIPDSNGAGQQPRDQGTGGQPGGNQGGSPSN